MITKQNAELPVLKCWGCTPGQHRRCTKCHGTGALFWAAGYAFPYTPQGEAAAVKTLQKMESQR